MLKIGNNVTVNINVAGAVNTGAYQFTLSYNPAVLKINSAADVVNGSFLGSTGRTPILPGAQINNTNGTVFMSAYTMETNYTNGPNGDGTLATITFTSIGEGTSNLDLRTNGQGVVRIIMADLDANDQPITTSNSSVQVLSDNLSPLPKVTSLIFNIKFQDVDVDRGPKTVKVKVDSGNFTDVTVNWNNGVYTSSAFFNVTAGNTHICVKGPVHLSKCFDDTLAEGENTRDWSAYTLLAGDAAPQAAPDNEVNILDYALFVNDIRSQGTPHIADFNMDGNVNDSDFHLIEANFASVGEL